MIRKPKCGACGSESENLVEGAYVVRTKFRNKLTPAKLCPECYKHHQKLLRGNA